MKIIHTADWHLGKILHKQDLFEDIQYFFGWLERYIIDQKIDVLLVSGDIFDLANPSNRDIRLYYGFLHRLSQTGIKTVITGGNHDSVSLLNAPSNLLNELNIHVIGGMTSDINDEIIPVYIDEILQCVVLAVPFLRDRDLRTSVQADEMTDKTTAIPAAIKKHYDQLVTIAQEKYGKSAPIIAMGHLYMTGSLTSDSEREIHVGNLLGLESKLVHPDIKYMALGHIHKPQRVQKQDHIRYSGSPVYLDFSEAGYEKMVIEINIKNNSILDIQPIPIPSARDILRIKGNLEDIRSRLSAYHTAKSLPTFIEIEAKEPKFDIAKIHELETLIDQEHHDFKIIKSRISFEDVLENKIDFMPEEKGIEELTPLEILDRRMTSEVMEDEDKQAIKEVYINIIESFNN